jgi:serine/threonine-protein kinase HipA
MINPSIDKDGLALNIDMENNALNFELAKSVGEFFMLNTKQMDEILRQINSVVFKWRTHANAIGISKREQEMMQPAFKL